MALTIVLATPYVLFTMPTDILPEINIPVISIIWQYQGLSAQEMGFRITGPSERILTTTVNDIEHVESQSLPGVAVVKVFLQPGANLQKALAQTVATEQFMIKIMPPGVTPPIVLTYSASSIPVVQLALSSRTLAEQAVNDAAMNALRPQLVTIRGVAVPVGLWRQAAHHFRRSRHAGPAGQGPVAARHRQCGQCAEPHPAFGHRQDGADGIHHRPERLSRHGGGAQRPAGPHPQRRRHLSARSRPRARRLLAANQYCAPGRPSRRGPDPAEDRQRLDPAHHPGPETAAPSGRRNCCRRKSRFAACSTSRSSLRRRQRRSVPRGAHRRGA